MRPWALGGSCSHCVRPWALGGSRSHWVRPWALGGWLGFAFLDFRPLRVYKSGIFIYVFSALYCFSYEIFIFPPRDSFWQGGPRIIITNITCAFKEGGGGLYWGAVLAAEFTPVQKRVVLLYIWLNIHITLLFILLYFVKFFC